MVKSAHCKFKRHESLVPKFINLHCAKHGYLALLKFVYAEMQAQGYGSMMICDFFSMATFNIAAEYGQLEVLKWLHKLNLKLCLRDQSMRLQCAYAAKNGHIEVLEWLCSDAVRAPLDDLACEQAARNGQLKTLKWIRSQLPHAPWFYTSNFAARGGHLEVLQWVKSQSPPAAWSNTEWKSAAVGGHLEVLKWIHSVSPFDLDEAYGFITDECDHPDILHWLLEQGAIPR